MSVLKEFSALLRSRQVGGISPDQAIALPGRTIYHFHVEPQGAAFSVTVAMDQGRWRLQHLESIRVDLSELPSLPCPGDSLPTMTEETLAWIRAEFEATERARLFAHLCRAASRDFALGWFRDGAGFLLAARAWLPQLEPRVAFIWFAAWSEAHLRGNPVILERADHGGGVLRLTRPLHRELYARTSHLRNQISLEDYESIFRTMWEDRAEKAGWELRITDGEQVVLRFLPCVGGVEE